MAKATRKSEIKATAMWFAGSLMWVIAAYLIYIGLQSETTVPTQDAPAGFEGVVNVQLVHIQAMNFHLGIGAAIVGAILIGAAAIVSAIGRSDLANEVTD